MLSKDEIIRMAREAGAVERYFGNQLHGIAFHKKEWLERFAALVAAHVTEALTKSHEAAFQSYVDQAKADRELEALVARLDEREECAKVCAEGWKEGIGAKHQGDVFAVAIRARGE